MHIHKTSPSPLSASTPHTGQVQCSLLWPWSLWGTLKIPLSKEIQTLRLYVDGLCPTPNVPKSESFLWRPPRLNSQNQSDTFNRKRWISRRMQTSEITLCEYGYRAGHWKIFRDVNTQKPKDWLRYLGRLKAWLPLKYTKAQSTESGSWVPRSTCPCHP